MPKRAASCPGGAAQPRSTTEKATRAPADKKLPAAKGKRQSAAAPKAMSKRDARVDAVDDACAPATTKKKRPRLFPADPATVRRVLAFDVGIVNLAHAVVTLAGDDEFAIESLGANNIMHEDPPGGPLSDDEIVAAAAAAGPRRRRRPGEAAAAPPKPKGRGAKEPLKVLTERITGYLWARADRLVGQRPHAIVIEQQSKKALRLSALGAVIHSFVLNYYTARGEEPPPVFMQSGRQKLRVVFRPPPSPAGTSDWRLGGTGSSSGYAPSLMTRFLVNSSSSSTTTTSSSLKTTTSTVVARKQPSAAAPKAKSKGKQKKAAQGAVWRANKKHAVDNFGPILAHYPGCRRWKPLFDQSRKKDDLADAALHAIFMLKAGGTSLARTKDLDEASLIVLPHQPKPESDSEQKRIAPKTRAPRRRRAPVGEPEATLSAKREHEDRNDNDDIIDLVHYATDPVNDVARVGLMHCDICGGERRSGTVGCHDDVVSDNGTICLCGVEPPLKRPRYSRSTSSSSSSGTTGTRRSIPIAQSDDEDDASHDDDTDEEDDEDEEDASDTTQDGDDDATEYDTDEQDDDDDWALDLGIC